MMKIVLLTALGVGGATIFGSLIGFVFRNISHKFSDIVLSFAGGTMLYVISDEMIPETHAHGSETGATYVLLARFCVMLVSDFFLG